MASETVENVVSTNTVKRTTLKSFPTVKEETKGSVLKDIVGAEDEFGNIIPIPSNNPDNPLGYWELHFEDGTRFILSEGARRYLTSETLGGQPNPDYIEIACGLKYSAKRSADTRRPIIKAVK